MMFSPDNPRSSSCGSSTRFFHQTYWQAKGDASRSGVNGKPEARSFTCSGGSDPFMSFYESSGCKARRHIFYTSWSTWLGRRDGR
jgi:hypothetical protein